MTRKWTKGDAVKFIEGAKTQAYCMSGKTVSVEEVRALLDLIKSRVEMIEEAKA